MVRATQPRTRLQRTVSWPILYREAQPILAIPERRKLGTPQMVNRTNVQILM